MVNVEAYRRRLQELEQARRPRPRVDTDVRRELLDLCRDETKAAIERAIAAEDEWRRASALLQGS